MEFIKFFQLLAIFQGAYILLVFYPKKNKKPSYIMLLCGIISLMLYFIGNDTNLWLNQNWFLFDINLFVTFFYLFIKYYLSGAKRFSHYDLWFFVPNLFTLFIELCDVILNVELPWVSLMENIVEWIYIAYLIHGTYLIYRDHNRHHVWLYPFLIGFIVVLIFSYFDDFIYEHYPNNLFIQFLASNYAIPLIVSAKFYYINYKLHVNPNSFLKTIFESQYKNSCLDTYKAEEIKSTLLKLMANQKIYKNPKLTLSDVSQKINVPKQYISQVINSELETNFNDFVNNYRINEFKTFIQQDRYAHYTLFGIAREAGFNSKSSFNTIFKALEGVTPSKYKKSLG